MITCGLRVNRAWGLASLAGTAILLSGCAEPKIEFRGYSDLSSCAEIIDAEMANGARFEGGFGSEDIERPGFITELTGSIFDEPVDIEVFCNERGLIDSVHYFSRRSDAVDTGAVFRRFEDGLTAIFGEPLFVPSENGRSLRYLCNSQAPVLVDEWRLARTEDLADDEEPPHEVYIGVMPRETDCLDEPQ